MSEITAEEICNFIIQQVDYWNAGKRDEMLSLYRRMAPKGLTMELVGGPIIEGWQSLEAMWDRDNGKIKGEIIDVMANGNEGACYCRNTRIADGSFTTSIEVYRFEAGKLFIRYFHRSDSAGV